MENNSKVASQEKPQISNRKETTKKSPTSVNHMTHNGRVYHHFEKERDVSKGKGLSNNVVPTKEEDDLVLK